MGNNNPPNQLDFSWDGVPQALAHPKRIQPEIKHVSRAEAETALTSAVSLAERGQDGAETALKDVIQLTDQLIDGLDLQMRAHEEYGKFLYRQKAFGRARSQFHTGARIAECLDPEDVARLRKCHLRAELAESRDSRLKILDNLETAAKDCYSDSDQLDAWERYIDDCGHSSTNLLAARKLGSVEYFQQLLASLPRASKK